MVCFLREKDHFYEGAYLATINFLPGNEGSWRDRFFLYLINNHYLYYFQKYYQAPAEILDLACGGGIRYLAHKGEVTGLDLSFPSLQKAREFYHRCVQGDALSLPFPDNSFDFVASCYGFEHFTQENKLRLLQQLHRVLRPGGILLMLFDCDNLNPLFRWLKKHPDLYHQRFVELDHHYGLQLPSENLQLLKGSGFDILAYRAGNKTLVQHLPVYQWMEPYGKISKLAALATWGAAQVSKYRLISLGYQAAVTLFDDVVEKWLPLDWARLLLVVGRKKGSR